MQVHHNKFHFFVFTFSGADIRAPLSVLEELSPWLLWFFLCLLVVFGSSILLVLAVSLLGLVEEELLPEFPELPAAPPEGLITRSLAGIFNMSYNLLEKVAGFPLGAFVGDLFGEDVIWDLAELRGSFLGVALLLSSKYLEVEGAAASILGFLTLMVLFYFSPKAATVFFLGREDGVADLESGLLEESSITSWGSDALTPFVLASEG